jgi:hypothetical protein
MLIIGMTAGIVVFSIPRQPSDMLSVSQQFERDVIAARDQAIAETALYGIEPQPGGYTIYRLVAAGWLPVEARRLPRSVSLKLEPEDAFELPEHREEIGFGLPVTQEEKTAALMPDILFAADGTATPFTATFAGGRSKSVLLGDPFGRLQEGER